MSKKVIAITGGFGTGKSTVTGMLKSLGGYVVSADEIAHRVILAGNPAYKKILRAFGTSFIDKNGEINRRALGRLVFPDPSKRKKLQSITHPLVIRGIKAGIREGKKKAKFVVLEIPLLFEVKLQHMADVVVTVFCGKEEQIKRLLKKGYTLKDAKTRISSQVPLEKKMLRSDHTVFNTSDKSFAFEQVKAIAEFESLI